jgi:glycosyltransferase involved in cell wall biosynthesis
MQERSLKITYFFRKPASQYYSIETVFSNILKHLPTQVNKTSVYLPHDSSTLVKIMKNIFFAYKCQSSLNHITGDIHYLTLVFSKKVILTIHDVDSALRGNILKRLFIRLFWFWLPALKVSKITVISDFTKKQLEKVVPFAKHKIVVIPDPVDSSLRYTPKSFNTLKPAILHIGTKPNKNLERTLEALQDIPCKLVVIGKMTDRQKELAEFHKVEYENKQDLSRQQMVEEYVNCDLLCFASMYEGFGLPVIEANAIGRPVVAGSAEAVLEVAQDAACMVDPYRVEDIRKGVLKVINEPQYRNQLIENGLKNIRRYDIALIMKQYMELYGDVLYKD